MATPAAVTRRGLLTDAVAAACVAAVSVTAVLSHPHPGQPPRAVDWLVTATVPLALPAGRRAPVLVAWSVIAAAWLGAAASVHTPALVLVAVAALYPLARERPLRYVWPPALVIAGSIAFAWIRGGHPWVQLWAFGAGLAALILAGVNARTRRAFLTELEERSRRLEIDRDQRARLAVADERARIAREMHDIVAHHLTVIVTLSDGAALTAESAPRRASQTMGQVSATGRAALVLVLTTFDLDEYVYAAIRVGASGFLLKDVAPADLASAIRAVAAGDAVMAPQVTRRLIDTFSTHLPGPAATGGAVPLSDREREVVVEIARGRSNAEVAARLSLAEATVKSHIGRILAKLALRDRVQIAIYAYETGIVTPGSAVNGERRKAC